MDMQILLYLLIAGIFVASMPLFADQREQKKARQREANAENRERTQEHQTDVR